MALQRARGRAAGPFGRTQGVIMPSKGLRVGAHGRATHLCPSSSSARATAARPQFASEANMAASTAARCDGLTSRAAPWLAVPAAGLASLLVMAPPALAEQQGPPPAATADTQALASSLLAPAGSLAAGLSAPEAPALVSNSGEALLEGVKGIVESGLQDLAANSMTPVGGPVTGDVVSATASTPGAEEATSPAGATAAPSLLQPGAQGGSTGSAAAAAQHQKPGRQHRLRAMWCSAWQAYCDALEHSPLPTKVYTGAVGTLLGDLAAQLLSHMQQQKQRQAPAGRSSRASSGSGSSDGGGAGRASSSGGEGFVFDALRTGRLCLYSAAVGTPMGHFWYALLEQAVMPAAPLAPAAVAAKLALDQLVQTPLGMALFFAVMKLLEGRPGEVKQELQTKMMPALLANWKLWPAAQLVNFALVPEQQRILYGNVVGICWTCVISNLQQQQQPAGDAAAQPLPAEASTQAAADVQAAAVAAPTARTAAVVIPCEAATSMLGGALRLRRSSRSAAA